MPTFEVQMPAGEPTAAIAARDAGFPVWQAPDGRWFVEAAEQEAAAKVQAWLERYDGVGPVRAAAKQRVKEEARRRIVAVVGPDWRQVNDTADAIRLCWRAIRFLFRLVDPQHQPDEQPLSGAELARAGELVGFWEQVEAIRAASDAIEAGLDALDDTAALAGFDPAVSPLWP